MAEEHNNSDSTAVEQCKKWLEETQNYSSVKIYHHPTDLEGDNESGNHIYLEVKMTGKDDYFGAATMTEWGVVSLNDSILKFVIARKDSSNKYGYRFYLIEANDFYKISTVPPFKINFNIKATDYKEDKTKLLFSDRKRRKGTIELNKEIACLMGDIYKLMNRESSRKKLIKAIKNIKNKD